MSALAPYGKRRVNRTVPHAAALLDDQPAASPAAVEGRAGVRVTGGAGQELDNLLSTLDQLMQVRFGGDNQALADVAAELHLHSGPAAELRPLLSGTTSLSLPAPSDREVIGQRGLLEVTFSDDAEVPDPFRGRMLSTRVTADQSFLTMRGDDRVLASAGRNPIWTVSEVQGVKHFRSALALPTMSPTENFSDLFSGERFLEALPLIDFLRRAEPADYERPPLRAAFIIDDPNLHWPRYGFVDYRELATHAEKEHYHVAFATIPMDTWFTHSGAAGVFRRNSRRISLLIHGNNHGRDELARPYSDDARKGLLHQAIRRIERLEAKANVKVCRVMVPPHGACSSRVLADLPERGFEAACISAGSLRAHNRDHSWVKTLGYAPSEIIHGCPVLPRWGLTGNVENTLLVAAYLGQPMILRGHHDDLKEGLGVFERYACFINGLGDVVWSNLTDLCRLNYLARREGVEYRVKPLGNRILITPPTGTTDLVLEATGETVGRMWEVRLPDGSASTMRPGERVRVGADAGRALLLEKCYARQSEALMPRFVPPKPKLILRRLLTEARDRVLAAYSMRQPTGRKS